MSAEARPVQQACTALTPTAISDLQSVATSATKGITIVCGFPASGKSTAARYLAELIDAVVIDKDTFAPDLEESVMGELTGDPFDRDSEPYMRVVNPHIYTALLNQAVSVGHHSPVVVDAPFIGHVRAAEHHGFRLTKYIESTVVAPSPPVRTAWIAADPVQIRARMQRRGAARDAGKLADWSTYRSTVLESGVEEMAIDLADYVIRN